MAERRNSGRGVGRGAVPVTVLLGVALSACAPQVPVGRDGVSPLVRLTPEEHARTVRDLFGEQAVRMWSRVRFEPELSLDEPLPPEELALARAQFPMQLPGDQEVHGFEGMVAGQSISPYHIESYQRVARSYSSMVRWSRQVLVCDDWDTRVGRARARCALDSMLDLATRAWRRPLTDEEIARLTDLWGVLAAERPVEAAMEGFVEALLQSPAFLYRLDDPRPGADAGSTDGEARVALTDWEMASRLSYALWDSMPDDALFQAAARGELSTVEQVADQARRMLADDRARSAIASFHRRWLDIDELFSVRLDRETYADRYGGPHYAAVADEGKDAEAQDLEEVWSSAVIGLRRALRDEADRFVTDAVLDGGGTLADLFGATRGVVTDVEVFDGRVSTEVLHGEDVVTVDRSGEPEIRVVSDGNLSYTLQTWPAAFDGEARAGVLTLPGFLAVQSHPVHPAPILRGVHLLERVACEPVGQPPADALDVQVPDAPDAMSTNRERLTQITSPANCAACHDRINPLGFAFEAYDSFGGYRTDDFGQPLDTTGTWTPLGGDPVTFNDAVDLQAQLARHPVVQDCYVRQWTRQLLGDELAVDDEVLVGLQQRFRDQGGDIPALLVDLVSSDAFRFRPVSTPSTARGAR